MPTEGAEWGALGGSLGWGVALPREGAGRTFELSLAIQCVSARLSAVDGEAQRSRGAHRSVLPEPRNRGVPVCLRDVCHYEAQGTRGTGILSPVATKTLFRAHGHAVMTVPLGQAAAGL